MTAMALLELLYFQLLIKSSFFSFTWHEEKNFTKEMFTVYFIKIWNLAVGLYFTQGHN